MLVVAIALGPIGCDVAAPRSATGPRVSSTTPADGASDVSRSPILRVELDRRIAPSSVGEQSVRLVSGARSVLLLVEIDVVRPALLIAPRARLDPEITYVLEIGPLRDLDGNLGPPAETISFHTGTEIAAPPVVPGATFDDVAPIFALRCASAGCHGGDRPMLGLDLSSAEGVRGTAIGIPATELRRPIAGVAATSSPALSELAIIEPGIAARSYLVYKVLGDPHVAGAPMPPTSEDGGVALGTGDIETVVSWIRAGATLPRPP